MRRTIAAFVLGALIATSIGVATAATTTTISACVNNSIGLLRIVSSTSKCVRGESPLTWNQQGPQGVPGPSGAPGAAGQNAAMFVSSSDTPFYLAQSNASSASRPWVAVMNVTVPGNGHKQVLVATFAEGHTCTGANAEAAGWGCEMRVTVNGVVAAPSALTVEAGFGNTDPVALTGSASMQFSITVDAAPSYVVAAEIHTGGGTDDVEVQYLVAVSHLTVEATIAGP